MLTDSPAKPRPLGEQLDSKPRPEDALLPFVREFEPTVRAALLADAASRTVEKGQRIHRVGQLPQHLCIIVDGIVELCGTDTDPSCGVLLLTAGDLLTPTAVLYAEPCLTSATALTRTRLLALPRETVLQQARQCPEVALALARIMGAQWRMAVRHIIDLKCRTAGERLAAFLLKFVDHSEGDTVELPFSKGTLAARLGVSPATLSRLIQVVAENGVLLRGSEIIVRDRERAEEFCGPEPYPKPDEFALQVHAL